MIRSTLSILAISVLTIVAAQAQEIKIGYVNSERILRESSLAKSAQTKLEVEFNRREKEINDLASRLKTLAERFEKDSTTLSESERSRRQREIADQDRDIQRRRREFQEDLTQRKNEELATVVERANKVIKQIFEQEKYDLIVQEVVFASPRIDITKKVMDALNASK
jgi:outer membrane protein